MSGKDVCCKSEGAQVRGSGVDSICEVILSLIITATFLNLIVRDASRFLGFSLKKRTRIPLFWMI
jgi:hypothetical protein